MTTYFIGAHYEVTNPDSGQTIMKYYYAGVTRIATLAPHCVWCSAGVRKYRIPQNMNVEYILGDHLGSASITTNADGDKTSEVHYTPWGEVLSSWSASASLPMEYTFTGQMSYMDDPITSETTEGFGLMFFNARWLDPAIGRFTQADSIVPPGVQGLDRYGYVNNNPISYTDPSGHEPKPCWATKVYSCNLTNEDMDKLSLGTSAERKFLENYLKGRGVLQGFIRIDVTSGILMWNAGTQDANIVVKDFLKTLNDASLGDIIGSAISIPGKGLPIDILNSLISIFSSAGDDQLQDFIDNTTSYIDVVQDDQPNSTLVMTYTFRETTSCGSDGNCDTTFSGALTVGIIQEADRNSILLTGTKATYFEEWFRKMVEGR